MSTRFDETEELVRDALRRQADRSPHPAAVLDALHAGRRPSPARGRSTALVLAAAAAVVLAAVGIPLGLRLTAHPAAQPAGQPTAPATSRTAPAQPGTVLRYKPTWLPPGVVASMRTAASDGTVSQSWFPPGTTAENARPSVELVVTKPTGAYANVVQQIAQAPHRTVHGVTAGVFADGSAEQRSRLVWLPEPGTVIRLTVSGVPDSLSVVQQVADSIVPDSTDAVASPIAVAALPGLPDTSFSVHGTSPSTWSADYGAQNNADTSAPTIDVVYGPGVAAPATTGGAPVTVGGRPGEYLAPAGGHHEVPPTGMVVVRVDGHWLEVTGAGASEDQLLKAADAVTVQAFRTPNWIGTR